MSRYGWIPQIGDRRDTPFIAAAPRVPLPESVDLRPDQPPIYDQKDIGSCVGQAVARCLEWTMQEQGQDAFTPSRLQLYYEGRRAIDTVPVDSGCVIRDVMKFVNRHGAGPEKLWPYYPGNYLYEPPAAVYAAGADHQVLSYRAVRPGHNLRQALSERNLVVFGISIYDSFHSAHTTRTGGVRMPNPGARLVGGHAIVAVGYTPNHLICANSWGPDWGDGGYFYLPWAYTAADLARDFWTVRLVEAG